MRLSRRLVVGLLICFASFEAAAQSIPGALPETEAALKRGEWPVYGGSNAALRWSPLDIIDKSNAGRLHVVWRWRSADHDLRASGVHAANAFSNESTPIMIGRTLYTSTSLSQVAAIDAVSGVTKWVYDPQVYEHGLQPPNLGWNNMGVAWWRSGEDERIVILTAYGFMVALDARTGKPIESFGEKGRIDLTLGLHRQVWRGDYTSQAPPMIVGDVIVVGSSISDRWPNHPPAPGDVRGFDVRSGKLLWTFHTIAQGEEPGADTWQKDSWKDAGNANVWAPMSADEELGYVYLPVSTPTNDYYGGHRPGDGLFGESLVCLDVTTGRKVWHYQLVHHGLWDYDLPAAPSLIDIKVDGRPIKAVAQVTKQAFVYVFDRLTGKPVWPIEEQPVLASSVPGESASKTQPIPSKPAPFDLQGARDDDLIDLSPEIHKEAIDIAKAYDRGGIYTPPSQRGTIQVPGNAGGGSWSGAAIDPETGTLYVGTQRVPTLVTIRKPEPWEGQYDFIGLPQYLPGPRGLPLLKPPFGSVVAIDMNSGEHRWRIPVGRSNAMGSVRRLDIAENLGLPARNWTLVTRTVMIVVQLGYFSAPRFVPEFNLPIRDLHNLDPHLWVYDKTSGEMLAEMELPANATGAPMTYMAGGKQFIVFPVGGGPLVEELIAVSL